MSNNNLAIKYDDLVEQEEANTSNVIESAPVIVVAASAVPDDGGAPDGYLLDWEPEEEGREHCMPLGYYNQYTISSFALRDIKAGEELTWDYSCEIWFDEDDAEEGSAVPMSGLSLA